MSLSTLMMFSEVASTESQGVIDRLQGYVDQTAQGGQSIAQQQLADPDYWGSVGIITITGILLVFLILVILIFFFWLLGQIMKNKGKKKPSAPQSAKTETKPAVEKTQPVQATEAAVDNDDEIIAVISAAIAAYSAEDGVNYRIRDIKRKENGRPVRPAWGLAGIVDNTRPF